jgi:uncharacterized protein
MSQPDFEGAKRYALERLERELPPTLLYHSVAHTRDDVLPGVERLAAMEGVVGESLLLLRTAALYHDIGFVEQYENNEAIGVRIAAQVLPGFGYSPMHMQVMRGIIMATRLPQSPHMLLEEIMADADLDVLGREDFWLQNQALRTEMATFGTPVSDEEWYSGQLKFLQNHSYFTESARTLRAERKQKNIEAMKELLVRITGQDWA